MKTGVCLGQSEGHSQIVSCIGHLGKISWFRIIQLLGKQCVWAVQGGGGVMLVGGRGGGVLSALPLRQSQKSSRAQTVPS